ncbi:MAG: NADH-quinone oxidoreductase subunit M [SAR202 cluster bacterium]|nr:NADH-quinone oxidoreductase subunit M [SAR202 cluster bacterium]
MEFTGSGLLTITIFLPIIAAAVIAIAVKNDRAVRVVAGATALIELGLSIAVFVGYKLSDGGYQHVDKLTNWIPIESLNIQYFVGVDGLSAPLVLLNGLLGMAAVFASWHVKTRVREYFFWLLILQASVTGVFVSLDFVLFFLMWELEMVPMFFLISIWGSGRKEYSAMKFLIFTFLGSAFMLVGILALIFSTGTSDMTIMQQKIAEASLLMPAAVIFTLIMVAFAVKLPVWPVHTWLPDAHTDAPTAVSVMLAGVLLKMGGYGMIRIGAGMFPEVIVDAAIVLAVLGVINVLYGAVVTIKQTDLKRLVAYSSISHMGYVLIGIASIAGVAGVVSPIGLTGAAMQMFTHGTITGLMFLVVGLVYEKAHTRYIPDLGGLATKMPIVAVAFLLAGLASLGLPGTSGFVAEILVFLGTLPVFGWATALAAFGVVITAGYILWMVQRTMFGPKNPHFDHIRDATPLELVPLAVLGVVIIAVGVYPAIISDFFTSGVERIVATVEQTSDLAMK